MPNQNIETEAVHHHFMCCEAKVMKVPNDLPRDVTPTALAGADPKLAERMISGRFVVGLTDAERFERCQICGDLRSN